jgi:hypothetical protein
MSALDALKPKESTPLVTSMRVIPVAGHDDMLLNCLRMLPPPRRVRSRRSIRTGYGRMGSGLRKFHCRSRKAGSKCRIGQVSALKSIWNRSNEHALYNKVELSGRDDAMAM